MYVEAWNVKSLIKVFTTRCFVMFVTAVCILFLLKLKWWKNKSPKLPHMHARFHCNANEQRIHIPSLGHLWSHTELGLPVIKVSHTEPGQHVIKVDCRSNTLLAPANMCCSLQLNWKIWYKLFFRRLLVVAWFRQLLLSVILAWLIKQDAVYYII